MRVQKNHKLTEIIVKGSVVTGEVRDKCDNVKQKGTGKFGREELLELEGS